jgi:hypothetical protein
MKVYGGGDVQIHAFLISALGQGGWAISRPSLFTRGEEPSVPTDEESG